MPSDGTVALTADEESAWRALTYLITHLGRALGEDLEQETQLTLSEYVVLVHLSEAELRQLRIGDLAVMCDLSPSRTSRLVDEMVTKGTVGKTRSIDDGRCMVATLTPLGLNALKAAYPTQLRNVRRRVFDQLSGDDVQMLGITLGKIRVGLELSRTIGAD